MACYSLLSYGSVHSNIIKGNMREGAVLALRGDQPFLHMGSHAA